MLALDEASFDTTALQNELPVLVDFWAPWCAPCKMLAPKVEALEAPYASRLVVTKVNTDEVPVIAQRFGVRGLPTLMLFRGGAEVDRLTGVVSDSKLKGWLEMHGVEGPDRPVVKAPKLGAFFGDPVKKDEVVARVLNAAAQGRLVAGQFSELSAERVTLSALMADSLEFEPFTPKTGLPYAFGMALDFVGCTTEAEVQAIFDAVPAGADVDGIPLRLLEVWLSDRPDEWARLVGDAAIDALRRRWLDLVRAARTTQAPSPADWIQLRNDAAAAYSADYDPYRWVPDLMARLVERLCPPPSADDDLTWALAMPGQGAAGLKKAQARAAGGWGTAEFALTPIEWRWLNEQFDKLPEGERASDAQFAQWKSEWARTHAEAKATMTKMEQDEPALIAPINAALRETLVRLCTEAAGARAA